MKLYAHVNELVGDCSTASTFTGQKEATWKAKGAQKTVTCRAKSSPYLAPGPCHFRLGPQEGWQEALGDWQGAGSTWGASERNRQMNKFVSKGAQTGWLLPLKPPTHTRRSAWNAAKRTTWRPSTGLHSFRHQQNPASMRRNGFKVGTCPHDTRDPFSTGSKSTRAFASAPFPVQGLDCAFWQLGRPRPAHFRVRGRPTSVRSWLAGCDTVF